MERDKAAGESGKEKIAAPNAKKEGLNPKK